MQRSIEAGDAAACRAGATAGGSTRVARLARRAAIALPVLILAAPAAAHSELRRSSPAAGAVLDRAPAQIELHFNQRVMLTALRLRRADGEEVALPRRPIREASSETIPLPPLPPGEWRAEWRIISADGHPVGGTIAFSIRP